MPRSIFRQTALDQLSAPEQLDHMIRVTDPMGWLALLALSLMLLAAGLWAVLGSLPTQVTGTGILISSGGVHDIVAPGEGQVLELTVEAGDTVEVDQIIAQIKNSDAEVAGTEASMIVVTSPYAGRVLELKTDRGSQVERGTPLLSIEGWGPAGETDLIAVVYMAPAEGKRVQPGMPVQVSPSTVRREEHGFLLGEVSRVGRFPSTPQGMQRVLGNAELARTLSANGAPIEVHITLKLNPSSVSGYAWSSQPGPPIQIDSGTPCTARVTLSEQRPIDLILPRVRQ